MLLALIGARCPETSVHGRWMIAYEDMLLTMPNCKIAPKSTTNSINVTLRTAGLAVTDDGF